MKLFKQKVYIVIIALMIWAVSSFFLLLGQASVAGNGNDGKWSQLKKNAQSLNQNREKPPIDVSGLGEVIIHESGRLKPLDSYARTMLLVFSGRSTFEGQDAVSWLARVMWEPEKTVDQRIFKITFDQVLIALGIKPDKSRRYTYNELTRGFPILSQLAQAARNKDTDYQSPADKEFLRIFDNFLLYNQIMNSFLFSVPVQTFFVFSQEVKESLGLDSNKYYFSYTDLMRISDRINEEVTLIQEESTVLSAKEVLLLDLKDKYDAFLRDFGNLPFRFFPSYTHGEKFFSAWEIFRVGVGKNVMNGEVNDLDRMVRAYSDRDQELFNTHLTQFKSRIFEKMEDNNVIVRNKAELFYNYLDPFYRAQLVLGIAFLFILGFFVLKGPVLKRISSWLLKLSLFMMLLGMVIRFIITLRPPITNLFETFIFVGAVSMILGIIIERFQRNGLGIVSGILSGVILLLISNGFVTNGDTMDVLVAVLRSNFWLSTHVITINLGYTGIFLSGVIGHLYLFQSLKKNVNAIKLKNTYRIIYAIQAFGLIFTLIGTILGGIWADQSWGRFWGWDPKENGSLMIVLWSAILFHARFDGMIKDQGYAIGSILGIVVLMIAWFGINLLGVGLHSYGFVAGIAYTLYSYIAIQIILVTVLYGIIEYRRQKQVVESLKKQETITTKKLHHG